MAKVADEILVNIMVNKGSADRDVRQWQSTYNRAMSSVEAQTIRTTETIRRSSNQIGGHLRTLAGALAAGVSAQQITKLLDNYTQLQNRLKVVGLEGQQLASVQERLFDTANRNGTAVNGLAELYSRMALSQKELGATTEQMLSVTSGVSAALRVQGISAEQAAGPLLQLGQAMGAGVVRAEEFNSLIEGMPTLLQAAANHIDGAAGSISKLRNMVLEGEITSKQFFNALLAGLPELESKASNASLTIGQAMTTLNNELIRYAGQVDSTLGVSEKLVAMIGLLSQNLDKIAPAVGVIATILGGRFLAGLLGSAAATLGQAAAFERAGGAALVAAARYDRMTVSTARMATASEIAAAQAAFAAGQMTRMQLAAATAGNVMTAAGGKILGVFGGPIGLAVTGLTVAISGLAAEAYSTSLDLDALAKSLNDTDDLIDRFQPKADKASGSVADIGNEADVATPKIKAFAGQVGAAAQQLWELARAKQAAALAELGQQRQTLSQNVSNVQQNLPENIGQRLNNRNVTSLKQVFEPIGARIVQIAKDAWTGGDYTTNNRAKVAEGMAALRAIDAEMARVEGNLEQFAQEDPSSGGGGGDGKKTKGGGKSAEAEARRLAREQERKAEEIKRRQRMMEDDLFRVGDALLQAMMERQLTAQERLDLDLEMLKRDRDANIRAIQREVIDGDKTEAEGQMLSELEEGVYRERVSNRNRQGIQEITDERLSAEQAMLDMQLQMLQLQSSGARSAAEARNIQLRMLEIQQKMERDLLESRLSADPSLDATGMRAQLTDLHKAQTTNVLRSTMDPLQQWFDQSLQTAEEVKEAYLQIAADGLDRLSNGFVDVIMGTKSVKDAFKEMTLSILADIAKVEARRMITSIATSLLPGFKGGGEIPGFDRGGWIGGRGTGTSDSNLIRASRGEYMVKERQARKYGALLEAINEDRLPAFASGGWIGRASAAGALPSRSNAGMQQVFYVDAKGSILAEELMTSMQQMGSAQAARAGLMAVSYQESQSQRMALRNSKRFI